MFFKLNLFNMFLVVLTAFVLNYAEKIRFLFLFLCFFFSLSICRENLVRNSGLRDCGQNRESDSKTVRVGESVCISSVQRENN